jgi:3-methyladenine DNA glycosylase AlkD
MRSEEVLSRLKSLENPEAASGMARFGINTENAYGVSVPKLRAMAKEIGRDHALAANLWASGIHEARMLSCFIDDPGQVGEDQMEAWVRDFDSWDLCDQCCSNLFDRTGFALQKAVEWTGQEEEFVKRAGFVLMAALAVHDKKAVDGTFLEFLPIIVREAGDSRNYVKKAVNWALRQIGKRDVRLNEAAIKTALAIREKDSSSARWIAADALRELKSEKVQKRLKP